MSKDKMPNLGRINPINHHHLYVERESDERSIIEMIEDVNQANIRGAIAICGTPGCGKTTFTKFLVSRIQNSKFSENPESTTYSTDFDIERIDMDKFSIWDPKTTKPMDSVAFINFLQEVHDLLVKHSDQNLRLEHKVEKFDNNELLNKYKADYLDKDFISISDLFVDYVVPISQAIKKNLVLIVDNLDLIPDDQQKIFVGMFADLGMEDNKIRLVYTARPVSNAIIQYVYRERLNSQIANTYYLDTINIASVIDVRFKEVSMDIDRCFSPENMKHLKKISCGNLDDMMKMVFITKSRKENKNMLRKIGLGKTRDFHMFLLENSVIPDIFIPVIPGHKVPWFFVLMKSLRSKEICSDKLFDQARKIANKMEKGGGVHYSDEDISIIVKRAITMYAIRRVEFSSYECALKVYDKKDSIKDTIISLTERGLCLLEMCGETLTHSVHFKSYPKGTQLYIEDHLSVSGYTYTSENPNMYIEPDDE